MRFEAPPCKSSRKNHLRVPTTTRASLIFLFLSLCSTSFLKLASGGGTIGVDYGFNGDNLLSPKQTVSLLLSKRVSRVRIYSPKPEILQAFANSGIDVMVGIANEDVPNIANNLLEAINWVTQNVAAFPSSGISAIIVGNEWLFDPSQDPTLLLPAILNIYTALTTSAVLSLNLNIKVSTSHSMNVLSTSYPPSAATFQGGLLSVLKPLLAFLEQTSSFFMINVFPYFAYIEDPNVSLDFALFRSTTPVQDPKTKLNYTNLFDMQLDAVYYAMGSVLGLTEGLVEVEAAYKDLAGRKVGRNSHSRVVVGESGWPSGHGSSGSVPHKGMINNNYNTAATTTTTTTTKAPSSSSSSTQAVSCGRICIAATVQNAQIYNQNLVNHVLRSSGTPANPTQPIDAYIFEVFNEDLKPPGTEQHYGFLYPNGSPVYPLTF